MASTSPSTTSSSSSPSPNRPVSVESYIGSFISLISKYEIRYEGVLYHLNIADSTIGLQNVRSFGTEGRRKDGPEIPPSDKVFEFILFRGSDIKDLQVKSSPTAQTDEQIEMDPAIIQLHYPGVSLSSSMPATAAGKSFVESAQGQSTAALLTSGYLPSHKTVSLVGSTNPSHDALNAGPSLSMPMYTQRHNGTLISESLTPQNYVPFQTSPVLSSPLMMQNQIQGSRRQDSPVWGLTNSLDSVTDMPSTVCNSLHTYSTSYTPMHHYILPDLSSYPSVMTSPPSNAAHIGGNQPIKHSIPLSSQATGTAESQSAGGAVSDPTAMHFNQPTFVVSSHTGSMPSPLPTTLPPLLSPDQLMQSRLHVHSSTLRMYPDQDMGVLQPSLSTSVPSISTPVSQPPLLPLPTSVQQHKQWTTQFTQEFDFDAMNEKFKKDEVWGYLGKAKQVEKAEVAEDGATDQSLGYQEVPGLVPDFDCKPAYKKDDFFDTISCNSLTRGRSGQARFSEQMKWDTETFGRFCPRPNLGNSGGHRAHDWEKGYGYGGRGHGNMPF